MEALVRPPASDLEPRLLLSWGYEPRRRAWVGSVVAHIVGIVVLLSIPHQLLTSPARRSATHITLIAPREFTQTEPNRGKIGHEFSLENLLPRPRIQAPGGLPNLRTPRQAPIPVPPRRGPSADIPEPPKVETASSGLGQAPVPGNPAVPPMQPPPQIQVEEKPKIAFEPPGALSAPKQPMGLGGPRINVPGGSLQEATRGAIRSGAGGTTVGDIDLLGTGGLGAALNLPAAPGKSASTLELLSNPAGVDFKPYLIQVLAAVKRNWLVIYPESARLGRMGRVQIQFALNRSGGIDKLVIALGSGTDALDRAAVAGIVASSPFPPLPGGFQGTQVRLQLTFLYNMK